jgi:hypothetical protein
MKIAFRTDAFLQMGSGHVMRCLTLANALKARGTQCHFISRAHPVHLMEVIRQRGYKVNSLAAPVQEAQEATKTIAKWYETRSKTSRLNPPTPLGWAAPGKLMREKAQLVAGLNIQNFANQYESIV